MKFQDLKVARARARLFSRCVNCREGNNKPGTLNTQSWSSHGAMHEPKIAHRESARGAQSTTLSGGVLGTLNSKNHDLRKRENQTLETRKHEKRDATAAPLLWGGICGIPHRTARAAGVEWN